MRAIIVDDIDRIFVCLDWILHSHSLWILCSKGHKEARNESRPLEITKVSAFKFNPRGSKMAFPKVWVLTIIVEPV